MSPLSAKDLVRWRERLAYARAVWTDEGILGESGSTDMRMLLEMYRGNQWRGVDWDRYGINEDELSVVNKIFPTANTMQAAIISQSPNLILWPRKRGVEENLRGVETLFNYDIREQNMVRQWNGAFRDHQFASFGVVRHGFTPSEEFQDSKGALSFYSPVRPDRPWIRRVAPWDVLLDPNVESFHADGGGKWVAFRSWTTPDEIKRNPAMTWREGLVGQGSKSGSDERSLVRWKRRQWPSAQDPDEEDMLELWTVYEITERTWFQLTLDGTEKELREQADWPIPWETLPVNVFAVNEQMDTPFAIPLLAQCLPIQKELNLLRTMMSRLVRQLRRVVFVNQDLVEPEELEKLLDGDLVEFFKGRGNMSEIIREVQVGGLAQELLLYNERLEEDLREEMGISKMGRAQRINVESATEAANVQAGQDIALARIEERFRGFVQETIRLYAQGRRFTMELTGDELVRIAGPDADGALRWAQVSAEDLAGEYEYEVEVHSMRPRDRDLEAQKAGARIAVAAQSPQLFNLAFFARKWAEVSGLDPSQAMNPQALVASAVEGVKSMMESVGAARTAMGPEGAAGGTPSVDTNALALLGPRGLSQ